MPALDGRTETFSITVKASAGMDVTSYPGYGASLSATLKTFADNQDDRTCLHFYGQHQHSQHQHGQHQYGQHQHGQHQHGQHQHGQHQHGQHQHGQYQHGQRLLF
ncbi:hypothetical protein FHG87_017203 [Trinorchestia longiramus]|nr:hypothetical protein FHG87_017203 [Trinorchestia longiramus]